MKKNTFNNCLSQPNQSGLSIPDKIRKLLEIKHKLVLVQKHELERLHVNPKKHEFSGYIDYLYFHYIIKQQSKTYLST